MKKFKRLIFGQRFDLYIDYQALRGIFNNKPDDVSSKIARLSSKTTDSHPNVISKNGKENVVANVLSRAHLTTPASIDAPPMNDCMAHIDHDLFNRLNSNEPILIEEPLRKHSDPNHTTSSNTNDNFPIHPINRPDFQVFDSYPITDNN